MNNLKNLCCINGIYTIKENYTQEERKQGLSVYTIINFIKYRHKMVAFKEITIKSEIYNKPLKNLLNFLLNTGTDIILILFGDTYKLTHTDNIKPCLWRFNYIDCVNGWNELKTIEQNENVQEYEIYSYIEYKRTQTIPPELMTEKGLDNSKYEDIKTFVRTYANAYGLDLPKEQTQSTATDYKPLKYLRGSTGSLTLADELSRKSTIKYYAKSRQAKEENPKEWAALARQITAYLDYEIPFINGFVKCKKCGKPINTNRVTDNTKEYSINDILFISNTKNFYNKCDFCNTLTEINI